MIKEGNDPMWRIELLKRKISYKSQVHQCLLEYLGISVDAINQKSIKEEKSEEFFNFLKEKLILTNKCEFKEFIETISLLYKNHQSMIGIKHKIEKIIILMKNDIKNIFSSEELLKIFGFFENRFILLILVEQNIIQPEAMIKNRNNLDGKDWILVKFFYPEFRKYAEFFFNELMMKDDDNYELKHFVEENDKNLELFYEKRKEGGKLHKIMELILEDNIDEFILFVEHSSINLNDRFRKQNLLFEIDMRNYTPIEYAAFFGSIAIFKYLYMKKVNIIVFAEPHTKNIIERAVQGRNYEIIHLLEENEDIKEELNKEGNQQKYLEISLKMHHNEIFEYFISNYNYKITEEIINLIIIYQNYQLLEELIEKNQIDFRNKAVMSNIFLGICKIGNVETVKILIDQSNIDINLKGKIFHHSFQTISIARKTTEATIQYSLLLTEIELNNSFKNMILLIWSFQFYIMTPFHYACEKKNIELIQILIDLPNIDINSQDEIIHHSFQMILLLNKTTETTRKYS